MLEIEQSGSACDYAERANFYKSIDDWDSAIIYYTKAIELEEKSIYYSNRAMLYEDRGFYDENEKDTDYAIRDYIKAIDLCIKEKGKDVIKMCYDALTVLYVDRMDYNSAIQMLDKILEYEPEWKEVIRQKEIIQESFSQKNEDYLLREQMLRKQNFLGSSFDSFNKGDYDSAIMNFTKEIEIRIKEKEEEESKADKDSGKILAIIWITRVHYYWRAKCHLKKKDYDSALADGVKAIEWGEMQLEQALNSRLCWGLEIIDLCWISEIIDLAESYVLRASIYEEKGGDFYREAMMDLNKALELIPIARKYKKERKKILEKIRELANARGSVLRYVPENFKTEYLCLIAVRNDGSALLYVPDKLKTEEMCNWAIASGEASTIRYVPKSLRTRDLCMQALRNDNLGWALRYIPNNLKTLEMCMLAVQKYAQVFVPPWKDIRINKWKPILAEVHEKFRKKIKENIKKGLLDTAETYSQHGLCGYLSCDDNKQDRAIRAIKNFTKTIELRGSVEDYYNRRLAYGNIKAYEFAIADARKCIELRGEDIDYIHFELDCWEIEDFDFLIKDLTKTIELRENVADYNMRAIVYKHKEEYDLAIADHTKAIELRGNAVDYKLRAETYECRDIIYQRWMDSAIMDCTKAIELRGDISDYEDRARYYLCIGKFDLAIADYEKAIELGGDSLNYMCAQIYGWRKRDYDSAIAYLTKAMKLTGEDIDIYHERANYYIEKKDYNAALVDCARAMELRNDPRQYFYTEGEGFKVAEMKEHAADYNLRARIYKHKGEYALAQLDYSKAIELRGMVLDYEERAEFYCERKDYDSAIADYKKVVELGGSINYYDSRLKEIDEYLSHKDNCECIEHWNKMKRDSNFCKPELYDPECLPF